MDIIKNLLKEFTDIYNSMDMPNTLNELKDSALSDTASLVAYGSTSLMFSKKIIDLPSAILISKLERFIKGISDIHYDIRQKLLNKLNNPKECKDFFKRILFLIDDIDYDRKIDILIYLFKALSNDIIDIEKYFRLSNGVRHTLYEDIVFLEQNFDKDKEFEWNINISSLVQSGLAYEHIVDKNSIYKISKLGVELFYYGINYAEIEDTRNLPDIEKITQEKNVMARFS